MCCAVVVFYSGKWGQSYDPALLIGKEVVEATYFLAESFEETWELLDFASKTHTLPEEPLLPSQPAAALDPESSQRNQSVSKMKTIPRTLQQGKSWQKEDLEFFSVAPLALILQMLPAWCSDGVCSIAALREILNCFLEANSKYFTYADNSKFLKRVLEPFPSLKAGASQAKTYTSMPGHRTTGFQKSKNGIYRLLHYVLGQRLIY